ncbi:Vps52/Sac2 [Suhomyces tanzawaensis NRRL Y-17324]|uniref:Vps52/Sac2 n=1 Tax=Suhomyces tanzawaensis NRRL Y-17324 TaxID=984487 RepID=A0A1E4SJ60_9ASCO|nr:Vps52/Sac2 [Suhomyces tanzawaensis NRRL Y-17324]ODV79539.1 Vps52/Sac2 [Suhomyces tanzawaensis NRRL Y-17324]
MSALDKLKTIFPLDSPQPTPFVPLDTVISYFGQNDHASHGLLELLRAGATLSTTGDLPVLSQDELVRLISKYENYKHSIRIHRQKLVPIDTILTSFSSELDHLSSSLVSLHEKSSQLSSDSSVSRTTTDRLNPIILDLIISPEVVRSLVHDDVDAKWVENIKFINEKLQLIAGIHDGNSEQNPLIDAYKDSVALRQLEAGVQLLIQKAIERIRDYIISQIKLLRSSTKVSSQTIQQNLLQIRDAYIFLQTHHAELASQLKQAYIYTMRWYYQTRFAKYIYALENLNVRHIDQNLVLGGAGNEDKGIFGSGLKGWLSSSTSSNLQKASPHGPTNQVTMNDYLLSIDKRLQILEDRKSLEPQAAIPSQIAETTPFAYWIEFVYNQWSIALVDNLVVEYLFMVDFFYQGSEKFDEVNHPKTTNDNTSSTKHEWSHVMFDGVFKMGREFVNWLITHAPVSNKGTNASATAARSNMTSVNHGTCDAFGILLMIRMAQHSQSLMHNEFHIPILDDYLNSILLILWPHFTKIIDLNCEALKKTILRTTKESNLAPVGVTQQFSQFVLGLLKLSLANNKDGNKDFKGEPLFISINRLKNDFENLLTKLSNHFFGTGKTKTTEKEIFLYNNYFLVVSILKNELGENKKKEEAESGGIIEEQVQHFETLCNAYKH